MGPIRIVYRFATSTHEVHLDQDSLVISDPEPDTSPSWTALDFNKCDHCPLSSGDVPRCPAAVRIATVIDAFRTASSTEIVRVEVETAERTYAHEGPLQHALQSLFGLVLASSGCPHLTFLRPMSRFHLPFATVEETLARTVSMHLLEHYVRGASEARPDLGVLAGRFDAVARVNRGILLRLKSCGMRDGGRNAMVILDAFAKLMRLECEDGLPTLSQLFA